MLQVLQQLWLQGRPAKQAPVWLEATTAASKATARGWRWESVGALEKHTPAAV
jgi:hypothetical protein